MSWPIRQYISFLQAKGKDLRGVWQAIKGNPVYKYTTNANIQNAITAVDQAKANARSFNIRSPNKTLGSIKGVANQSSNKNRSISYTFTFKGRGGTPGSSAASGTRYFNTTVPLTATKAEIMAQIRAEIREWVSQHYEGRSSSYASASITITSIWG